MDLKPVRYKLSRIGFSVRQFLVLFLIVSVILFLVQIYTFSIQMEKNRASAVGKVEISLQQANTIIDYFISSIQELLRTSIMREDLFSLSDAEGLLDELTDGMIGVQDVYVRQENGRILCGNMLFYQILENENIREQMDISKQKPNEMLWSQPYYSKMQAANALCVAFTDGRTGKTIAAEVNLKILYQNLSQFLRSKDQSFVIMTQQKNVILFDGSSGSMIPTVNGEYPLRIDSTFDGIFADENGLNTIFTLPGFSNVCFMQSNQNMAGWYVTAMINEKMLQEGIRELKTGFGISLAFGLSLICVAVFIVVFFFTKPLRQLAETMERVKDLDTLKTIENKRVDEVGRLTECYNRLVLRIQKLVLDITDAEKKKALYEFRMHQSQIGPHFLRNTLYCIASLLRQERIVDAENGIKALAGLLSYSFDNSEPEVLLDQEISSLEKYVSIQKIRYGNTFSVNIKKATNVGGCKVLKFTLQPLVENAILHGLSAVTEGDGKIFIRAYRQKDILTLLVADNGCGMSQEGVEDILSIHRKEMRKDRYSGIGVANIQERIRLNYGEGYGMQVFSRLGSGTIVRIRLPYRE